MSLFVCPICGAALEREPGRYRCPAGHSYDVAREGYTHLLPANRKHSKMPGDDKGMAAARSVFLSKDYYADVYKRQDIQIDVIENQLVVKRHAEIPQANQLFGHLSSPVR